MNDDSIAKHMSVIVICATDRPKKKKKKKKKKEIVIWCNFNIYLNILYILGYVYTTTIVLKTEKSFLLCFWKVTYTKWSKFSQICKND